MIAQFNINKMIREHIKTLNPYTSARDDFKNTKEEMVFLDANENPFNNGLNRYPDPYQYDVKIELSKQKKIATNQIFLGNGSDEILDILYRVFCEPKQDNVITIEPTYGMYGILAQLNLVENQIVNLLDNFQLDIPKILETSNSNTKIIFLCSPNNPTANSFDKEGIENVLKSFNGLVVIDEAYIDFSPQESWLRKLNEYPNLVIVQTLSKAYAMAGARLGICYASKTIISALNKIKLPYNVNVLTQQKVLTQLSKPHLIQTQVQTILEQRILLSDVLKSIYFVLKVYPSDTNFLLVKVDNANKRYQQLINLGIVVRNRSTQVKCSNCLRFTIGTKDENKKLIHILNTL